MKMRLIVAASAVLLLSSTAFAADDDMANYYGNTLITKSGFGESHAHYKADHTVTANVSSMMGSMTLNGTWSINDKGEMCRNYSNAPSMMPNPLCYPWTAHKVGDTWQITTKNGTADAKLVAGVQ
jgi:hypothetical protein